MKRAALLAFLALGTSSGCAREAQPARAPACPEPASVYGWLPPPAALGAAPEPRYAVLTPAPALGGGALGPAASAEPVASRPDVPTFSSSEIPSGDACIAELGRAGVAFHRLQDKRGISTPVEVTGKIGGIRYLAGAGTSMVADCRFVVALGRVAPVLSELGVTSVRFSGAYSYRMSRVGRLSLHAHGLALDVHEVQFGSSWQSVERDFTRGLSDGCAPTSPPLNQLGCRLRATRLFKELLTPDYDFDHRNHFHLAIAPLDDGKPAPLPKRAPAPKPAPKPAKPPPPEPALAPDDGEPVVLPEEPPPATAKPEPKASKAKSKAKPKPTRPARHHPPPKRARPIAS